MITNDNKDMKSHKWQHKWVQPLWVSNVQQPEELKTLIAMTQQCHSWIYTPGKLSHIWTEQHAIDFTAALVIVVKIWKSEKEPIASRQNNLWKISKERITND